MAGKKTTISNESPKLASIQLQTSSYGITIPEVYGTTRVSGNLLWYSNFRAVPHTERETSGGKGVGGGGKVVQETTTYTYTASVIVGLSTGTINGVTSVWKGKDKVSISDLGLTVFTGALGQPGWNFLSGYLSTPGTADFEWRFGFQGQLANSSQYNPQALNYSGIAYVAASAYDLGDSGQIPNHSFEISGKHVFNTTTNLDADPKNIVEDILLNGARFPISMLGDTSQFSDYCVANDFLVSPAFIEQQSVISILTDMLDVLNSAPVWSDGVLKFVPYGDKSVSGNGRTFSPNVTPVYDLSTDDFIGSENEEPITITRSPTADAYNSIPVEFMDRANQYNLAVVTATDDAHIEQFGLKKADVRQMHMVTRAATAQTLAQLGMSRNLFKRNTYSFVLGWRYARLEPMDIVTLTEELTQLDRLPVRITELVEDEDGKIYVTAEDFPIGIANAPTYQTDNGLHYQATTSTIPNNVAAPFVFEVPAGFSSSGFALGIAVGGQPSDVSYGGCCVWMSSDGTNYKRIGILYGSSRYGVLTAPYPAASRGLDSTNTLKVQLASTGQLISGSAFDAASGVTAMVVGQEFIGYGSATLTGLRQYDLNSNGRGVAGSLPLAHATGTKFARLDANIFQTDPLELSMLNNNFKFKFTAFNVYGSGEQELANVVEYSYTPNGYALFFAPADVSILAASVTATSEIVLGWPHVSDKNLDGYEIRQGTNWNSATFVGFTKSNQYRVGVATGNRNYLVKAKSVYGVYSANAASTSVSVDISNVVTSVVIAAQIIIGDQGTKTVAFLVSWTSANPSRVLQTIIEYKRSSESTWQTGTVVGSGANSARINNLQLGTSYDVRIAEVYSNGIQSPWQTTNNILSSSIERPLRRVVHYQGTPVNSGGSDPSFGGIFPLTKSNLPVGTELKWTGKETVEISISLVAQTNVPASFSAHAGSYFMIIREEVDFDVAIPVGPSNNQTVLIQDMMHSSKALNVGGTPVGLKKVSAFATTFIDQPPIPPANRTYAYSIVYTKELRNGSLSILPGTIFSNWVDSAATLPEIPIRTISNAVSVFKEI